MLKRVSGLWFCIGKFIRTKRVFGGVRSCYPHIRTGSDDNTREKDKPKHDIQRVFKTESVRRVVGIRFAFAQSANLREANTRQLLCKATPWFHAALRADSIPCDARIPCKATPWFHTALRADSDTYSNNFINERRCLIKNSSKSRQKDEEIGQNYRFSEFLMRTEPRGERIWSRNPRLTSEKRTRIRWARKRG